MGILLLKLAASMLTPAGLYPSIARTGTFAVFSEGSFAIAALTVGLLPPLAVVVLLNPAPAWSSTPLPRKTSVAPAGGQSAVLQSSIRSFRKPPPGAASIGLLTMLAGAFAPVSLVLLPRGSAQVTTGDIAGLRRLVLKILVGAILLATAGVVVGELVIPPFIRWYFREAFVPAIPVFRACLIGAIPYAVYILMRSIRSILDALDVKALNSRNLIISMIVVVVLRLLDSSLAAASITA